MYIEREICMCNMHTPTEPRAPGKRRAPMGRFNGPHSCHRVRSTCNPKRPNNHIIDDNNNNNNDSDNNSKDNNHNIIMMMIIIIIILVVVLVVLRFQRNCSKLY